MHLQGTGLLFQALLHQGWLWFPDAEPHSMETKVLQTSLLPLLGSHCSISHMLPQPLKPSFYFSNHENLHAKGHLIIIIRV